MHGSHVINLVIIFMHFFIISQYVIWLDQQKNQIMLDEFVVLLKSMFF